MRIFKQIADLYIFSNIHVALASFSLTKLTLLYWHIDSNIVPLFVFFSTILSYNYVRLTRIEQIDNWFANWLKINKVYLIIISTLSFVFCIYLGLQLRLQAFFMLLPFSFLTGLYVLPPAISRKLHLRNLPAFKIFIIALSWAGITVLFPLIQYGLFSEEILWLFFSRFLFVIALTIPFDIRDVSYDAKSLKTLPIWLGVKNAKKLGIIFLILFLIIDLIVVKESPFLQNVFIAICLGYLLVKASINQNKYYSAFWVEGIPILWLVLYMVIGSY